MAAPKPMTKNLVLDYMAKKTKVTKKFAGEFIDEFIKLSYKEAKKSFVIPGLGKLVVVNRKARMGRNPATGQTMQIPCKESFEIQNCKSCKGCSFIIDVLCVC
ncbi:MAG: HU family DNA-binding protein [Ignavibacteriales bacterium]|nr:HU family DNA-binding protein [Ignavibacteriales bacterium]